MSWICNGLRIYDLLKGPILWLTRLDLGVVTIRH